MKVEVPQYLSAAKSYALAADSSSSYAPEKEKKGKKKKISSTFSMIQLELAVCSKMLLTKINLFPFLLLRYIPRKLVP